MRTRLLSNPPLLQIQIQSERILAPRNLFPESAVELGELGREPVVFVARQGEFLVLLTVEFAAEFGEVDFLSVGYFFLFFFEDHGAREVGGAVGS